MLEDALSYPTKGDNGLARLLIGGALMLFSLFIIPGLIAMGYVIETLAAVSRGEEELPAFEDWGNLLMLGLKSFVVNLAYTIVPTLIIIVSIVVGLSGAGSTDTSGLGAGLGIVSLVGVLVGFLLSLPIAYIIPAAYTNLGRTGKMGSAFDFGTLKPVVTTKKYFFGALFSFFILMAVGVVFSIVSIFTFGLGYVFYPFAMFWVYLAGSYMFGLAFKETTQSQQNQPPETNASFTN
ncbi:DUF4013 domain-containing protein [Haladaptatus cibarius]|uniref:DUF4013 domain-containing protein n=1 Tax=Haladaptatus cibarius TaxID=453847 RepID=UPI00067889C4|nr:DUF4013 domain-containing protein [Haladaptatus cibarius]